MRMTIGVVKIIERQLLDIDIHLLSAFSAFCTWYFGTLKYLVC